MINLRKGFFRVLGVANCRCSLKSNGSVVKLKRDRSVFDLPVKRYSNKLAVLVCTVLCDISLPIEQDRPINAVLNVAQTWQHRARHITLSEGRVRVMTFNSPQMGERERLRQTDNGGSEADNCG